MSGTTPARGGVIQAEYRTAWTGITEPPCDLCSWAWHQGRLEVKFINRACRIHSRKPAP